MARKNTSEGFYKFKDITGQQFGWLRVMSHDGKAGNGQSKWLCECVCGKVTSVLGPNLRLGTSKSCGCKRNELLSTARTRHGESRRGHRSPEYIAWWSMVARCCNPGHTSYADYGGRGISVCESWRISYEAFLHDIGRRPSKKHSLDRIDVNGNYCLENCRWATHTQQCRNRRSNTFVECFGERRTIVEWSEVTGLSRLLIANRLRAKWDAERALSEPPRKHQRKSK